MKRKKLITLLLTLCCLVLGMVTFGACNMLSPSGTAKETEGLSYRVAADGQYAIVTAYNGTATDVVIASSYEGVPVTVIGSFIFRDNHALRSITIPDSVNEIGEGAFSGCISLTSINVSENNANYKDIDGNLYSKDGTTLIQYAVGKTATSFTIPDSVTSIGYGAFSDCDSLTSVVISNSVTSIGEDAFYNCYRLTSVYITNIAAWCNISFGNGYSNPLSNGANLYINNQLRTELIIPDTVTEIKSDAFYNCSSLTSVVISDSVTSIGVWAFDSCDNLTSVEIGDSVTTIGSYAFYSCDNLTSITFNGTVAEWNAIEKGSWWNAGVPATKVVCRDGSVAI